MNLIVASIIFLVISVLACNNVKDEKSSKEDKATVSISPDKQQDISDLEPILWKADSLQVLYYDNPDGDSLRYSRFFSYVTVTDSTKINFLLRELDQSFLKQENKRGCRSEGKFFLLKKDDILKTIYFSAQGNSCSYMYFIKDGSFIYFPMTENAKEFFGENKKLAKKP